MCTSSSTTTTTGGTNAWWSCCHRRASLWHDSSTGGGHWWALSESRCLTRAFASLPLFFCSFYSPSLHDFLCALQRLFYIFHFREFSSNFRQHKVCLHRIDRILRYELPFL